MDVFKRSLAPVVDGAWEQIEDEARRALRANLSARRVVDVSGPHGLAFGAVPLGRLDVPANQPADDVCYGRHLVQPLVEVRVRFELDVWELDNVARGARDLDLDAVARAAEKIARFEETAVYDGFDPGCIRGLAAAASHAPIDLGKDGTEYPDAVLRAMFALQDQGVDGPYALVLGSTPYRLLQAAACAYPPAKIVSEVIGGPVVRAPFLEGGFLIAQRGGDAELTLGQDVALGYETHDTKRVRLFLTESLTFRVLEERAVVRLTTTP